MKSYVKKFSYLKKDGIEEKTVFVMNATSEHIQGFDLAKLDESEVKELTTRLKEHEVQERFGSSKSGAEKIQTVEDEQFKAWLRKAWRTYNVSSIQEK